MESVAGVDVDFDARRGSGTDCGPDCFRKRSGKNLTNPQVVVVDVRKVEEYKAGHIPGAVNVAYGSWAIKKGDLLNELPPIDDLAEVIGNAGIDKDSIVVIVGKRIKFPISSI